jgi:hypothetical protein
MLDSPVTRIRNFEKETVRDVEGDEIPKEKMLIFELADKTRIAVRGSGTEPKIKYYLFGARLPKNRKLSREELAHAKDEIGAGWRRFGIGCKKTRISALPNNSLDTAQFAARIATWDTNSVKRR